MWSQLKSMIFLHEGQVGLSLYQAFSGLKFLLIRYFFLIIFHLDFYVENYEVKTRVETLLSLTCLYLDQLGYFLFFYFVYVLRICLCVQKK